MIYVSTFFRLGMYIKNRNGDTFVNWQFQNTPNLVSEQVYYFGWLDKK